jgi:hypothetical protein
LICRAALAIAAAALALAVGACGEKDEPDADGGAAYAAEVEAIMSDQVIPAGTAAIDSITNVAQGENDLDAVLIDLSRAADDLRAAQRALTALDPPEAVAVPAEEMAARIGVLADRLAGTTAAQLEADPNVEADNVHTDLDRIENRAQQIADGA